LPPPLLELLDGRPAAPVWRNEAGGWTVRLADRYLKWSPVTGPDLRIEAERLQWVAGRLPVPTVLEVGSTADGSHLATAPLDGRPGSDPSWHDRPAIAAAALGRALRLLHDTLPVRDCPYRWDIARRRDDIIAATGTLATPTATLLAGAPAEDDLVVCCGDPCAPNTLLDEDGGVTGFLDLGRLGVADRWADLAVGSMSIDWNLGVGHQSAFFAGYGIAPDRGRIAFYRELWFVG
jgi:kanamycin kinase